MKIVQAKYYKSSSAIPLTGSLKISSSDLRFTADTGALSIIDYKRIIHLSRIAGELHIELSLDVRNSSEKFIIEDSELYYEIYRNWMRYKPGLFNRLDHLLHGISVKKFAYIFAIIFPAVALLYTAVFFHLYRLVPLAYDDYIGESFLSSMTDYFPVCEDKRLNRGINNILEALPRDEKIKFHITILDVDEINAFALPGGKIVLFRKLITSSRTPEELASVIAHEIAHIEKRHSIQKLVRTLGAHFMISLVIGGYGETYEVIETVAEVANLLVILKYSRGFEEEADQMAFDKLIKIGVDPKNFVKFFERIQQEEEKMLEEIGIEEEEENIFNDMGWLSTHPPTGNRIALIEKSRNEYKDRGWKRIKTGYNWNNLKKRCSPTEKKSEPLEESLFDLAPDAP